MAFLRALSKMGLVELSPEEQAELEKKSKKQPEMSMEEIDRLLAEDEAKEAGAKGAPPPAKGAPPAKPAAAAPPARPAAPPAGARPAAPSAPTATAPAAAPPAAPGGSKLGRSFDELYREGRVPPCPYNAEKLLRLLDGLGAMDELTRRTAVLAMDAADDGWTIADPVLDAKRKIAVLSEAKRQVDAGVSSSEQSMHNELARLEAYQEEMKKTIHDKIAALEAQLQRELQELAQRRATLIALGEKEREAARLEHERLDKEVARLEVVPRNFEPALRDAAQAKPSLK